MLVVALRPQELQELDRNLLRDLGHPPHLTLEPLSLDDITRMVSDASGRTDAELSARLQQVTGGNPLFVMETLEQLDREGWPVNPDLAGMPPLGLEELHNRRFRSQSETCRSLLEALAVVGRPAGEPLLRQVTAEAHGGRAAAELAADLEQLQRDKWLDREIDGTFRFQQGQVARMLYQQIEPRRRRTLHLAVTTVLEREGSPDLVEWTRHAIDARELDLALRTFGQAVAFLQGFGAQQSAMQLYEGMLQLLEQIPSPSHDELRRRTRRELGELYCAVGDYARAKRALMLSREGSTADEIDGVSIALARVHRLSGEIERAIDLLEQVLGAQPSLPDKVAALAEMAEVKLALDAHDQVLEVATEALKVGAGDSKALAQLHGLMAMSLQLHGRPQEAQRSWEMALAEARACGDLRQEANILNRWAIADIRAGELTHVSRLYRSALECARQIGDVERVAAIQFNLATYHLIQGELGACLEHLPGCVRMFEAIGALKNIAHGYSTLGPLQYRLGLYEQAWVTLKKGLDAARRLGTQRLEAVALANSALVQAERGHFEQARQSLAGAQELFDGLGWTMETAEAMLDLAEVELIAGDATRALEALRSARHVAGRGLRRDLEVRAVALEARVVVRGDSAAALANADAALEEAIAAAREIGSPELAWRCHAAAVELFDASHRSELADQHMKAALEILERVAEDLPPDVRLAFWQSPLRRSLRERAVGAARDRGEITAVETAELDPIDYEPETVKQGPLATRSTMTLISNLDGVTRKDPTRR
jgi:tetratricopeptide (TPR) repeat protein